MKKNSLSAVSVVNRRTFLPVLLLILSLLAGSLSSAGSMHVYASEGVPETEAGTFTSETPLNSQTGEENVTGTGATGDDTTGGDSSGSTGGETTGDGATGNENGTGTTGDTGTTSGDEGGSGAPGAGDTTSGDEGETGMSGDDTVPTIPEEEIILPEDPVEVELPEEGLPEELLLPEEEEIVVEEYFVEEDIEWNTSEAMMASSKDYYDPTDLYPWVHPAPRGYKVGNETVIPEEKSKKTKTLSEGYADIGKWDHIWFGKPYGDTGISTGKKSYGNKKNTTIIYDYGEENQWLNHIRWRVLDPEKDNTALIKRDTFKEKNAMGTAGEAMFLMAEGAFGDSFGAEKNTTVLASTDEIFGSNINFGSYSDTSSLMYQWYKLFPEKNFSAVEQSAVKAVSKTESEKETLFTAHGVSMKFYLNGSDADKTTVFQPTSKTHNPASLSNAKVFPLSASEVLTKKYGFYGTGTTGNKTSEIIGYGNKNNNGALTEPVYKLSTTDIRNLDAGYKIIYKGEPLEQNEMNPDEWDSRVLPWKGFRPRGGNGYPPNVFTNSLSWRLRNGDNSIVSGMQTNWYASTGGVTTAGNNNPAAFRPGMNIYKDNILFVSEAENGKNEDAITTNGTGLTWLDLESQEADVITEYKLTLYDERRNNFDAEFVRDGENGPITGIKYSGAAPESGKTNEYISVLIKDKDNNIRWYGRVAQTSASGEGTIPIGLLTENGYWRSGYADKLYVFSEQHNPSRESDYASKAVWLDGMDAALSSDKATLHWTINPDNYRTGLISESFILANASDADITVEDVAVYYVNEQGQPAEVDNSGRFVWSDNLKGAKVTKRDRSKLGDFTVTLNGEEADFVKNTKLEKRLLVITYNTDKELRIGLDYTVLREKYEIGNGTTTTTESGKLGEIDFKGIAPDALGEGKTPPEKSFTIFNHGRQDMEVTAQLVGDDAQYFEFVEGTNQATIPAVGVGQTVESHTFKIKLKAAVPEKTGTFTLSIRVEPKATYNNTIPEEFPDGASVEPVHNYTVDVKFRGLPAGYRLERADSGADLEAEVSIGNYKPADTAPEKDITFQNTGRYPLKINVSELSNEDAADFEIVGITVKDEVGGVTKGTETGEGETEDDTNTNIVPPDGELTVKLRAVQSTWKATYERPFSRKEMNLKVHVHDNAHVNPPDNHYQIPVTFNMYPKTFDPEVDKETLDFGTIKNEDLAGAQSLSVTITNRGSDLLTLNDVNITGDDTNAFYFAADPQRNLGLPSGYSVTYTLKPMTGLADREYGSTISAKVNGVQTKLCDLKLKVGQVDHEIIFTTSGDLVFNSDTETLANTRTRLDLRNNGTKPTFVNRVYIEYPNAQEGSAGQETVERFRVEEFTSKNLQPNETLSFVIKPLSAGMQTGETYEAYICVETDPEKAFNETSKKKISLKVLPNQYYLQQEEPNVGTTLSLGSIEDPDAFASNTFNGENAQTGEVARGVIRLSNKGRQPLNIMGAFPEDKGEKEYFKVAKYQLKLGNAWQTVTPDNENGVILPIDGEIRILVCPTEAILAEAGKGEAVTDTFIIRTKAGQVSDISVPVRVDEVKRSPYFVASSSKDISLGAYRPELDAPQKRVILTNSGEQDVYLPWPEIEAEDENRDKIEITSIKVTTKEGDETTYTSAPEGSGRMPLPSDATAEVTLRAKKTNRTGREPQAYSAVVKVTPMKLASSTEETQENPDVAAMKDPTISIRASYQMYAPQVLLAEQNTNTVDLGQRVEPYTLEEQTYANNTVFVKNNGRLTLVPDTEGWVIDSEGNAAPYVESTADAEGVTYFRAVNFRVQQDGATEAPLSDTNQFAPGTTLFFDIVPVERNKEDYEITAAMEKSKLVIPFKTKPADADDTEEKAEVKVNATIKVLTKQYRAESVMQDAAGTGFDVQEAALDFGGVTLAGNPVQPAAQDVIIQNTGRDPITIKKVWLEDASEYAGSVGKFEGTETDDKCVIYETTGKPLVPKGQEGDNVMRVSIRPKQPSEELNSYGDTYKVNIYAETDPATASENATGKVFLGTAVFEIRRQEYHVIAVESATSEKSWSGELNPAKAYPENAPEEQIIYLKNIGNQELTISNLQISAGGRYFEITGTEPALPATLDPKGKGTLQVKVLPKSLEAETPYTGTLTVTTNQTAADTNVNMTLAVDKMPYVLVQDPDPENVPVLTWEDLVAPDVTHTPVEKTVTITNIGRKPVTISGIDLKNEKGFEIKSATNGGTTLDLATAFAEGTEAVMLLPEDEENPGANELKVTVETLADISNHAGEIFDDTLTVGMKGDAGENLSRSFDLKAEVDKREYDFSIKPVGTTDAFDNAKLTGYDPQNLHAGLGIFRPEDTAPSVTFEIKNTGNKTVYLRPVQSEDSKVLTEVTELNGPGMNYVEKYNEDLKPGGTAKLTIRAVPQHAEGTATEKVSEAAVRIFASQANSGSEKASDYTDKTVKVSFGTTAPQYAIRVKEIDVASGDVAHADFGEVPFESLETVAATKKYIEITNIGWEILYPMGEVSSSAGDASGFTYGNGEFEVRKTETGDFETYTPKSFGPGTVLRFEVQPKGTLTENLTYAEDLTLAFASDAEGTPAKDKEGIPVKAEAKARLKVLKRAYDIKANRSLLNFGMKNKGVGQSFSPLTVIVTNSGGQTLEDATLEWENLTYLNEDGDEVSGVINNTHFSALFGGTQHTANIGSEPVAVTVVPGIELASEPLLGTYQANLVLKKGGNKYLSIPVFFMVGKSLYEVTANNLDGIKLNNGDPVLPETKEEEYPSAKVTLTNVGERPVKVKAGFEGPDKDFFVVDPDGLTDILFDNAGQNQTTLDLTIRPTALIPGKAYEAELVVKVTSESNLNVNHHDIRIPVSMVVDKEEYAAEEYAPAKIDFGNISPDVANESGWKAPEQSFEIVNTGRKELILSAEDCTITGDHAGMFAFDVKIGTAVYSDTNPFDGGTTAKVIVRPRKPSGGFTPNTIYDDATLTIVPKNADGTKAYASVTVPLSYRVLRKQTAMSASVERIEWSGTSSIDPDPGAAAPEPAAITISNDGISSLTVAEITLDENGEKAFEITNATALNLAKIDAPGSVGQTKSINVIVRPKAELRTNAENINKTHTGKLTVKTAEGPEVTVDLSAYVKRYSYATAKTERVVFDDGKEPAVENVTPGEPGLEPGESILEKTMKATLTNTGREDFVVTDVYLKGMKLNGTGTNKKVFRLSHAEINEETGLTLTKETAEGNGGKLEVTIGLTDDEDAQVTSRENVTYEAILVIETVSANDPDNVRTEEIPVECHVRQKAYRIEVSEKAVDLGIADYDYPETDIEKNHQKTIVVTNTGRKEVAVDLSLGVNGNAALFVTADATTNENKTIAPGGAYTFVVKPVKNNTKGDDSGEQEYKEYPDTLTVKATATAAGVSESVTEEIALSFRTRKPHYMIRTDQRSVEYGTLDAKDAELTDTQRTITVTNIGNIPAAIKAEITGGTFDIKNTEGNVTETVTLFTFASQEQFMGVPRDGSISFTLNVPAASVKKLSTGTYTAELKLTVGEANKTTYDKYELTIPLSLWVLNHDDPTLEPLYVKTEPLFADFGEAYASGDTAEGTRPEKQITLENYGGEKEEGAETTAADVTLSWTVATTAGPEGYNAENNPVFRVTPAEFSGDALSLRDTQQLTVSLISGDDKNRPAGNYFGTLTVKAQDNDNPTRQPQTIVVNLLAKIVPKPEGSVTTYGIATGMDEVVFADINPMDDRPDVKTVTITNTGTGVIRINGISLQNEKVFATNAAYDLYRDGKDVDESLIIERGDQNWSDDKAFVLIKETAEGINLPGAGSGEGASAGGSSSFTVQPGQTWAAGEVYTAEIVIETDRENVQKVIPVVFRVKDPSQNFAVEPSMVDFGEKEAGSDETPGTKMVSITNEGNIPLELTDVQEWEGTEPVTDAGQQSYVLSEFRILRGDNSDRPGPGNHVFIAPGKTLLFAVKPKPNNELSDGAHVRKIVVLAKGDVRITVPVSYVIQPTVLKWETEGTTSFGADNEEYEAQAWKDFTVRNTSNVSIEWTGVTFAEGSWIETDAFKAGRAVYAPGDVTEADPVILAVGQTLTFKARPRQGLTRGVYTEDIKIHVRDEKGGKHDIVFTVSFRVKTADDEVLKNNPESLAWTELVKVGNEPVVMPEATTVALEKNETLEEALTLEKIEVRGISANGNGDAPFVLTVGGNLYTPGEALNVPFTESGVAFTVQPNAAYDFEVDRTYMGTLTVTAKETEGGKDYTAYIPVSVRVNNVSYALTADKARISLGSEYGDEGVPSDYTAITPRTATFTNDSNRPVKLKLDALSDPETFEIKSFLMNDKEIDPTKYYELTEEKLQPGETAVITIAAKDGRPESTLYETTVRLLAHAENSKGDSTEPLTVLAEAKVPAFFRVGATPADAYRLQYNMDEVIFEDIDPEENPVGKTQLAAVNASTDYPTLVTITNTGSRAVAVESIVLADAENGITATDYFEITDVKLNGVSAPNALTDTKLQPGETVVATDENGDPYETRENGDVLSFRVHVKEGAEFHEKTTYAAKIIVTTDRGVERDGREIPVTLNVQEQRPAGIWMKDIPDQEYNGTQIKPAVEVYYGNKRLTTADYTIAYKNNTNAATSTAVNAKGASIAPTVTIKGKGNYAGQIVKTFTIKPLGISDAVIPFDDAVQLHNVDEEGKPVQINVTHVTLNATGKPITAITIVPTRLVNGKTVKLAAKKDFEVRVSEAVNLTGSVGDKKWSESPLVSGNAAEIKEKGIYKIPVYGLGNYAGDGKPRYIYAEVVNTNKKLGAVETRTLITATAIPGFPAQTYAWGTDETHPFTDGKQFVYLPKTFDADYMDRYKTANGFVANETETAKNRLVTLYSAYKDAKKGTVVFETDITNKKTKAALVLGKDYLLTYANNDRVGTASVTITGIGNDYYGSVTKTFKINGLQMKSAETVIGKEETAVANLTVVKQPELETTGVFKNRKVTDDNGREHAATYLSEYDTLKKAFWYTGEAYNVAGAPDDVSNLQITTDNGGIRLRYNTGTKNAPNYVELVKGKHYYVRYTGNVNPGTASVEFVGNEAFGYTGVLKKTFKIQGTLEQEEITVLMVGEDGVISDWKMGLGANGKMVQIDPGVGKKPSGPYNTVYSAYVWHRGGVKPKPEVYFGAQRNAKGELIRDKNGKVIYTEKLTEGVDYSLSWKNNAPTAVEAVNRSDMKKFKQPTLTITGLGRFKGSKRVVNFDIYADKGFDAEKKNVTRNPMNEDVTFTAEDVIWSGKPASAALKQKFYLTDRTTGVVLKQGTDYYPLVDAKAPADKLIKFEYTEDTVIERYQLNTKGAADTKAEKILVEVPAGTEVCMNAKGTADVVDTGRTNKDKKAIYRPVAEGETGTKALNKDDIIPAGTELRMVVHGKGFYEGHKVETTFRVISTNAKDVKSTAAAAPTRVVSDIAKMTVKIPDQQWTGKAVTLEAEQIIVTAKVTSKVGNKKVTTTETLIPGKDFEIVPGSFVNNVNKGTAKVTIRGTYGNPERNDKMNAVTGEPNDPLAYIGGMKTVTFKIVPRQMNYTISYDANEEAMKELAAKELGGSKDDYRITGVMKDTVTAYGAALPANKFVVQKRTITYDKKGNPVEKWATLNPKKEAAIVFKGWELRGKEPAAQAAEEPYETYKDKAFFVFTSEANPWYNDGTKSVWFDNSIGKLVGEWYRVLVYGDRIPLSAQWEIKQPK